MGSAWKALSDDNRRQILLLLKDKEMTPSQLAQHFEFTFPAVSSHLRVLRDADLVVSKKQGKNEFYFINQKKALELLSFFEKMWGYKLDSLKEFVENKERKK